MIIAIAGASGFIGQEIARQALRRGDSVRLLARREIPQRQNAKAFRGDITTGAGLSGAFYGADVVINAAGLAHRHSGEPAAHFARVNGEAAGRVVRIARECGVARVVMLSSISIYGGSRGGERVDESSPPHPITAYGESKLLGEREAASVAAATGPALRILRLATVYGAGDPGNFVRLIRAVHKRRFVRIGTGQERKTILHRSDAARACLAAADDCLAGTRCFNVVGGVSSVQQIVSTISNILGVSILPLRIPSSVARATASALRAIPGNGERFARAVERWLSDEAYSGAALEAAYGFRALVGLVEGLTEEVTWYLRKNSLPV